MAGNQGGGQGTDETVYVVVILSVVFLLSLLIAINFHYIAALWQALRIMELSLFAWVPPWLPILGDVEIKEGIQFISSLSPTDIDPETIEDVDKYFAKYFAWIPSTVLLIVGIKLLIKTEEVGQIYDMESLLKRQSKYFPHAQEFLSVNPEKMDLMYQRNNKEFHAYAMGLSPEEFSRMSPPIGLEKEAEKDSSVDASIWDGKSSYDIDLAERAFKKQLGRPYESIENLRGVEKELYLFLIPKLPYAQKAMIDLTAKYIWTVINGKKSDAKLSAEKRLFLNLKRDFWGKKIERDKVVRLARDLVIKKKYDDLYKAIVSEAVMSRHAFVRTGLMSMLSEARMGGIIAPLEMRNMIKSKDRVLWYCVSSVGKKVSFVECAGCFSHWLVENYVGRPLHKHEVTAAVDGLFKGLKLENTKKN